MKLIKSIFFSVLSTVVLATSNVEASTKDGFYVGAGGGVIFDHFKHDLCNTELAYECHRNPNTTSGIGTAFVGFGYTTQSCLFLGLEVGTMFPERDVHSDFDLLLDDNVTVDVYTRHRHHLCVKDYVTFDALLGYRVKCDWLLYGRIGGSWSQIGLHRHANADLDVGAYRHNRDLGGLRLGLGVNYSINSWVGVGLDYTFTAYQKAHCHDHYLNNHHRHHPQSNYIGLSLIFSFPGCN